MQNKQLFIFWHAIQHFLEPTEPRKCLLANHQICTWELFSYLIWIIKNSAIFVSAMVFQVKGIDNLDNILPNSLERTGQRQSGTINKRGSARGGMFFYLGFDGLIFFTGTDSPEIILFIRMN